MDEKLVNSIVTMVNCGSLKSETDYYRYIKSAAVKNNIPYERLLGEVRKAFKERKFGSVIELVKHYHATGIDSFENIINDGYLLSRDERKKRGISTEHLHWSASNNVQFTHDIVFKDGTIKSGYVKGVGASGVDVVFVFGKHIFDEESYDASHMYPTVEKLSIKEACVAIIVEKKELYSKVCYLLKEHNLDVISVFEAEEWDPTLSSEELENIKEKNKKSKMKDFISGITVR